MCPVDKLLLESRTFSFEPFDTSFDHIDRKMQTQSLLLCKCPEINSSKKVLQLKFDLLYITLFSVFSTKIGIIRKLV